jgi:SAM-dependent methyltransferase
MMSSLKRHVPTPIKRVVKEMIYFPFDQFDVLLGRRDRMEPPKRMIYVGGGDFKKSGEQFLRYFVEYGLLKPDQHVLDVGCGIGRMAIPLTRYLSANGQYEGFDVFPDAIRWCTRNITPRYPNFNFQLVDMYNQAYYPAGHQKASQYSFPYPDNSFDFVLLTSVFTHMLPFEMERYLSECVRVLKRGGRCFITYFLLNGISLLNIEKKLGDMNFEHSFEGYRTVDKDVPEGGIAFYEDKVLALYEGHGMQILPPIHYGSWCGRPDFLSYQDIVIAVKA